MKLTGKNTRYDAASGAFLVQQSDELKLLMQISERLYAVEAKLDALVQRIISDGREVDKQ